MPSLSVLHVAQPFDAGVPRVASSLAADQVARGFSVAVAGPVGGDLLRAAGDVGARVLEWEASRSPGPSTLGETRRLAGLISSVSPDLVHLHSAKAGVAGRLALRGRVATVFQPHAWSFEAAGRALRVPTVAWERLGARWADVIVCVSEDERRRGAEAGVSAAPFEVVPNGVDLSGYAVADEEARAAARASLGVDVSEPLAVIVGRLAEQKGQDTLLRGWASVLERVPSARLALVGDGPDREALEALGASRVVFAGDADPSAVREWLAAADVTVIPSRWEAGLSLVAMEAMARGRSVVATDVAGMSDGLRDGGGVVVPVDAVQPLADAVAERLLDPSLAEREGAAGRATVEARYDLRVACDRMADLYDRVLAKRRGSRTR